MTSPIRFAPLWLLVLPLLFLSACLNPCKKVECQNGGTCDDGTCQCPDGYEGDECEDFARDKFIGTYLVSETCASASSEYEIRITEGPGLTNVVIHGLYNLQYALNGTINGGQITIPPHVFDFITIEGNGQHTGQSLSLNFNLQVGNSADPCTLWGEKTLQ